MDVCVWLSQLESTKSLRFIGICHSELGHLEEARSFHKRHLDVSLDLFFSNWDNFIYPWSSVIVLSMICFHSGGQPT